MLATRVSGPRVGSARLFTSSRPASARIVLRVRATAEVTDKQAVEEAAPAPAAPAAAAPVAAAPAKPAAPPSIRRPHAPKPEPLTADVLGAYAPAFLPSCLL